MDTHHTGYSQYDLIYIETEKMSLTIRGSVRHPKLNTNITRDSISNLSLSCSDVFKIELYNRGNEKSYIVHNFENFHSIEYKIVPIFFEQQNYHIIIDCKEDYIPEFYHENIHIRKKVAPTKRNKSTISGIINFGNEIGLSDLKIYLNGNMYLNLTIEIFPSKVQYQEDYRQLMADVTDEIYNLAFDFMTKTYHLVSDNKNTQNQNSPTEFFSIIKTIYDKFIKACDFIIKKPHHQLKVTHNVLPSHKIRYTDRKTIKWLSKHSEQIKREEYDGKSFYNIRKALSVNKSITFDTIENQFVKFILLCVIKKLNSVKIHYRNLNREQDVAIINQIDGMIKGINNRISFTFLNEIQNYSLITSMSLVFAMAPGYREIYKYYIMLLRGLSINSGIFNISVKNVSLLYEYWCFIKINSMLKEKYHLIKHDILRVDKRGMFVTLKKGNSSKISYKNPRNGEEIDLIYNPLSINIPTVSQQPDNILSISKNKSKIRYKYIFDAKYRINPAIEGSKYKQQYIFPGPEEEDINNMHRYRDALVYENGIRSDYQRTMFGAFVLFPYSDEQEYINHHFYKSIERVNIGGLPFLPNATKLVNNLLDDLINESSESAFERAILPIGIEEKLKEIDFSVRDVMVGTMRSKEQFKIMLENNFYYIPVKYLPDTRFPIRYIALYKSQNIFGNEECGISHYGGVIKYSLIKRNQINEIKTKRDPNALYYRFEINSWKRLENIILPREFGPYVTVFTNMFLLENCEYLPELYISSEEEYRLYFELKRLSSNIEINDDKDVVKGFSFNGCNIVIDDDTIRVYTNNDSYVRYSLKEFKRRPRYIFNDIKRVLGV